jgi:hypothetical protein
MQHLANLFLSFWSVFCHDNSFLMDLLQPLLVVILLIRRNYTA